MRDPAAAIHGERVLIRREAARDTGMIRAITAAAFSRPGQPPGGPVHRWRKNTVTIAFS